MTRFTSFTFGTRLAGSAADVRPRVEAALKAAGADVVSFVRLAVGEGIEKEETDFAAEVAATVKK